VVVGNRIECYGFCPRVGKEKVSRCSIRAHASRSSPQRAVEPRAGRSAVEVPCGTGWGAVEAPVERASYESEPGRGRGAPSSGPRTSRSRGAVEAPRRAGLVRVGAGAWSRRPVERASYETNWVRGRGGLSFIAVSVVLVFWR
jgi:hypothetical protein